jgi:6-phosphofructokinase 1
MGNYAVNLLEKGIGNRVVGIRGTKLVDYDIQEALQMSKPFDDDIYDLTSIISI